MAAANTTASNASGTGTNNSGSGATSTKNKKTYNPGAISKFLNALGGAIDEKTEDKKRLNGWFFCPPSDNLWTVEFRVHKDSPSTAEVNGISSLYSNVNKALQRV